MNSSKRVTVFRRGAIFGWWSALAVLAAVGCGEVTNLGNNAADAGEGGSSGDGGASGDGSGGKPPETELGGQAGDGLAKGGQTDDGRGGDAGGQGGEGIVSPLPYPLNPTVPISADCSCADDASICNAAGECVPRCEPGGVCAVWRVDRSVQSMLTHEGTLYFILSPERDVLGNPLPGEAGQMSLWNVHYPDPAPTKLAMLEGDRHWLLSHTRGKTYIATQHDVLLAADAVTAVDASGTVVEHALPDDISDIHVNPDGVFTLALDGSIQRLTLETDGSFGAAFEGLLGAADLGIGTNRGSAVFASDRLWRQYVGNLCSFDFGDLQATPHCIPSDNDVIFGTMGSRAVVRTYIGNGVSEADVDTQDVRYLWLEGVTGTMAAGFITGWVHEFPDEDSDLIARFPTEGIAQNPTPLISQAVARAMTETDEGGYNWYPPVVTSDAVYWTQGISDQNRPGISRYIFRTPLPQ